MSAKSGKVFKTSFWGAVAFYVLIGFEFFYMAGPFAVFFYSAYSPALNYLNQSPYLAWLVWFFMPHVARTSSTILNISNLVGGILAASGFICFCIGAFQVYSAKISKRGVVTGGIYNYVRHPQYSSFAVCSLGILILWPRFISLIMFVVMLFAYYMLARLEEKECEKKFGSSYTQYMKKTNRFLPFSIPFLKNIKLSKSKRGKVFAVIGMFILILTVSISLAMALTNYTLNNLYALYDDDSVTISISPLESEKIQDVLAIAFSHEEVNLKIQEIEKDSDSRLLNYVLPVEWFVPEIPMQMNGHFHASPSNYDDNLYKVIITQVYVRSNDAVGQDILKNIVQRQPIIEVWINVEDGEVTRIVSIPERVMYEDIPVALY